MTIEIPDREFGAAVPSSEEAKLDLAIGLYTGRRISIGRAARIANRSTPAFLQELGRRGVAVSYSIEDLDHDLTVLGDLKH